MSARTPGPWAVNGQVIWFDPGHVSGCKKIARMVLDHSSTPAEIAQSLADAEYIVTACNAHDELVAALQDMVTECDRSHEIYLVHDEATLDRARVALAKVQP